MPESSACETSECLSRSVIAPHLPKPGLRVAVSSSQWSFFEAIRRKVITREQLDHYGFVLVEGYVRELDRECFESPIRDDATLQFIHRDITTMVKDSHEMCIVTLCYPEQQKKRGAHTVLGYAENMYRRVAEFILRDDITNLDPVIRGFREQIEQCGIESLQPLERSASGLLIKDDLFLTLAKTVRASGYPRLPELYEALRPHLYYHEWKPNQLLVFNDDTMVHGRVPHNLYPREECGGTLFRCKAQWHKNASTPEQLQ